jgi:hypothetical protein
MRPDERGGYVLQGSLPLAEIDELAPLGLLPHLSITRTPLLTIKLAQRLERLRVDHLWLWCEATARAMQHVLRIPALRVLDILRIGRAGRLDGFAAAGTLEVLRANYGMPEDHLLRVTQCEGLRELGAQNADLTRSSLAAILALPRLGTLDLESTAFDDAMARRLGRSESIHSLDLGATRLTAIGLAHLIRMQQLRSLDLWATNLDAVELALLRELPNLQYLSLGTHDRSRALDAAAVTKLLLDLPSLERVWLDGVDLDPAQHAALAAKLASLRVEPVDA